MIKDMCARLPRDTMVFGFVMISEGWIFFDHVLGTPQDLFIDNKRFNWQECQALNLMRLCRVRDILQAYVVARFMNENIRDLLAPSWAGAALYDLYCD